MASVSRLPAAQPGALALSPGQTTWTAEQQAAFASIGLDKTPDADRIAYLHICQRLGLDPWAKEVFLIGRNDSTQPSGKKWTVQTGIDGFRTMAQRTGRHRGETDPQWCGPDGEWRNIWSETTPPFAARAGVRVADPVSGVVFEQWAVCHYTEFVPIYQGRPMGLWPTKARHMLAKCAKAQAYRAAYPREAAGVYGHEEMHQADALVREQQERAAAEARRAGLAEIRGDVIEGVLVMSRADLEAEFRGQAAVLGRTPEQLAARWAERHKKPLADATDEELFELVLGYREIVRESAKLTGGVLATAEERASERTVDAETVKPEPPAVPARSRDEMLVALADQAKVLGKSQSQHIARLLTRERCSLDQVTDEALAAFLAEQQPFVDEKLREDARTAEQQPEPAPQEPTQSPAGDAPAEPEPHPFVYNEAGDNVACEEPGCGLEVDADVHAPQPGPGQEPLL